MSEEKVEYMIDRKELKWEELPIDESYRAEDKFGRSAVITFRDGKFFSCAYDGLDSSSYNFADWMFLLEVAEKIKKLNDPRRRRKK